VLVNKQVEFVPVATDSAYANVQLVLKDVDMNMKAKNLDVAQALLSLGFARAESVPKVVDTEKDKELLRYYKYLLAVEKKAKNRRMGLWSSR
jgi:endonuclease YncB( thermonuclease family)